MSQSLRLRILRTLLAFCGVTWGVSICGVFMSWSEASQALQGLGAQPIACDRMLDYWLRMASGAFTLVGMAFFFLAINPRRYAAVIPVFGWIMVLEGIVLLGHGWRLHLPPFPFVADVTACLLAGLGILWLRRAAQNSDEAAGK